MGLFIYLFFSFFRGKKGFLGLGGSGQFTGGDEGLSVDSTFLGGSM